MSIVSLDDMKAALGVTFDTDDALISTTIAAAQAHLEAALGYVIATEYPDGTPADLGQAVKLLAAHWYENREASLVGVAGQNLPLGVDDIIRNRRHYSWADDGE